VDYEFESLIDNSAAAKLLGIPPKAGSNPFIFSGHSSLLSYFVVPVRAARAIPSKAGLQPI